MPGRAEGQAIEEPGPALRPSNLQWPGRPVPDTEPPAVFSRGRAGPENATDGIRRRGEGLGVRDPPARPAGRFGPGRGDRPGGTRVSGRRTRGTRGTGHLVAARGSAVPV